MAIFASSNLAFFQKHTYETGAILELVWLLQSCAKDAKVIKASEQNNVATEERWGHLLSALNKDASFSLLIHWRKRGTECLPQVWSF